MSRDVVAYFVVIIIIVIINTVTVITRGYLWFMGSTSESNGIFNSGFRKLSKKRRFFIKDVVAAAAD